MKEVKILVAATPEVLYGFLQNKLEREYFIHCQFEEDLVSLELHSLNAKGFIFRNKHNQSINN